MNMISFEDISINIKKINHIKKESLNHADYRVIINYAEDLEYEVGFFEYSSHSNLCYHYLMYLVGITGNVNRLTYDYEFLELKCREFDKEVDKYCVVSNLQNEDIDSVEVLERIEEKFLKLIEKQVDEQYYGKSKNRR